MENPCVNCKYKSIDWRNIKGFENFKSNPACINCYEKECYRQSMKPTHKVAVELADNEVLVKYTIKDEDMDKFIGRTEQLTNYVCGTPIEVDKDVIDATFEDSIISTLENDVESTITVLDSPIKSEEYINGEYHETYLRYMGDKVEKIVTDFCK